MTKTRLTLTLGLGVVLGGIGLAATAYFTAAGAEAQQQPRLPESLLYTPASASLVGHLDFASLWASPLREQWEGELEKHPGMDKLDSFRRATGIDSFEDVLSATFSTVARESTEGHPRPEHWGVVILGAFDTDQIRRAAASRGELQEDDYGGTVVYRLSKGEKDDEALAFPEDATVLLGDPDYVRQMLDARRDAAAGTRLLDHWNDGSLSEETFWLVGSPEAQLSSMWRSPGGGELPPLSSFALSARLDNELALRARGLASDGVSAQKLADVARGFVALGSLQQAQSPEIAAIVDSVRVERLENEVQISLSIPYDTLRKFSERTRSEVEEEIDQR